MIRATIAGAEQTSARMLATGGNAAKSLRAAILRLAIKLSGRVKAQKLSGQVLNVRTGRLRRSITHELRESGTTITGVVGTNVEYAAAHEFGRQGTVSVRAHLRAIKQAWGKELATPRQLLIGQTTRAINLPQRSFLRSALIEMEGEIHDELIRALRDGLG